jgi:enamine deaminase RidA (YjgF/YER057c/UK114 family)
MTEMQIIEPEGFPPARGYSNGIATRSGRTIYVAGQVGWERDLTFSDDFVQQFGRAIENVVAVVAAGGGRAEHITQITIYVTDMAAYRGTLRELGRVWRERVGKHYPAATLVEVKSLVEPRSQVEIQAIAVLPDETR